MCISHTHCADVICTPLYPVHVCVQMHDTYINASVYCIPACFTQIYICRGRGGEGREREREREKERERERERERETRRMPWKHLSDLADSNVPHPSVLMTKKTYKTRICMPNSIHLINLI